MEQAPGTTTPPPSPRWRRRLLLTGAAKAHAARDALLGSGLDPARLFLVEGSERARREPGPRAYFGVRLGVRRG
jgi:hypothetical protein